MRLTPARPRDARAPGEYQTARGSVETVICGTLRLRGGVNQQLVDHSLRQFALFEIENSIMSEQDSPARLLFGLLGVEVFRALFHVIDLPIDDQRALLTFADVPAEFIRLPQRQPVR